MGKLAIILLTTTLVLITTSIICYFTYGNKKNQSQNTQTNDLILNNLTLPNSQDLYIKINENVTIYGTLSLPTDASYNHPLIIIAPGSGPTDHNGNTLPLKVEPCSYYYLAKNLQESNIATFRYDKRLIGKSIPTDQEILIYLASHTFISDYISDFSAILTYLATNYQFPEIYILGHSQGSLLVLETGSTTKQNIKGVISLSGAGYQIGDVLKYQLHNQLKSEPQLEAKAIEIINGLEQGKTTPVDQVPQQLAQLFGNHFIQEYWISWMQYYPSEIIKTVKCPVQIIQGNQDSQITVEQAQMLYTACKQGDAILCSLDIINNMNHVLKYVKNSEENLPSYYNPNLPLNTDLVPTIQTFINQIHSIQIH